MRRYYRIIAPIGAVLSLGMVAVGLSIGAQGVGGWMSSFGGWLSLAVYSWLHMPEH